MSAGSLVSPLWYATQGRTRGENKIGANALHSLAIANTNAATSLALHMCRIEPDLATVTWGKGLRQCSQSGVVGSDRLPIDAES